MLLWHTVCVSARTFLCEFSIHTPSHFSFGNGSNFSNIWLPACFRTDAPANGGRLSLATTGLCARADCENLINNVRKGTRDRENPGRRPLPLMCKLCVCDQLLAAVKQGGRRSERTKQSSKPECSADVDDQPTRRLGCGQCGMKMITGGKETQFLSTCDEEIVPGNLWKSCRAHHNLVGTTRFGVPSASPREQRAREMDLLS